MPKQHLYKVVTIIYSEVAIFWSPSLCRLSQITYLSKGSDFAWLHLTCLSAFDFGQTFEGQVILIVFRNSEASLYICAESSLFTSEPYRCSSSVLCNILAAGPSDRPESIKKQLSSTGPGMPESTSMQRYRDPDQFRGKLWLFGPVFVPLDPSVASKLWDCQRPPTRRGLRRPIRPSRDDA